MLLVSNPGLGSPPGKTKLNAIEEESEEIKTFKVVNEGKEKTKTVAKLDAKNGASLLQMNLVALQMGWAAE